MTVVPYHIAIQMKQKELTKVFMMNFEPLWSPWFIQTYTYISWLAIFRGAGVVVFGVLAVRVKQHATDQDEAGREQQTLP